VRAKKVAIDGPCASGKSTVARALAERLGYRYINTGAMYRAVAFYALRSGVDPQNEQQVAPMLDRVQIDLRGPPADQRTILNGQDVTEQITSPEVASAASAISSLLVVRQRLVYLQQQMAKAGGVVLEGRDIGTVVLPDAECKFFLTASLLERARRRKRDYEAMGVERSLEEVKEELSRRDHNDMSREHSPLIKAPDAIEIDSTGLGVEEVVQRMVEVCRSDCQGRRA